MSDGQERLGSAAEEAARLLSAAQEWARGRGAALLDGEHLATGSAECQVCPVCQAVRGLRQVRPDAVEHLLDAAASFVAALRTTMAPAGPAPGPEPTRGVQHIDVRGEQGWD